MRASSSRGGLTWTLILVCGHVAFARADVVDDVTRPDGATTGVRTTGSAAESLSGPLAFTDTLATLASRDELEADDVVVIAPPSVRTLALDPELVSRAALIAAVDEAIVAALPEGERPTLLGSDPAVPGGSGDDVRDWLAGLAGRGDATLAILVAYLDVDGRTMRRVRFVDADGLRVRHVEWRELEPDMPVEPVVAPPPAGNGRTGASVDIAVHQCVVGETDVVCDFSLAFEAGVPATSVKLVAVRFIDADGSALDARIERVGGSRRHAAPLAVVGDEITLASAWLTGPTAAIAPPEALEVDLVIDADRVVRRVPAPVASPLR